MFFNRYFFGKMKINIYVCVIDCTNQLLGVIFIVLKDYLKNKLDVKSEFS